MKIKREHLETLRAAIVPLDTPTRRAKYLAGDFPRSDRVKDLAKRYRWDLLWLSKLSIGDGSGRSSGVNLDLYAYMNDDHIDTALKSIVDFKAPADAVK